jgi:UDP-N-acetylmuramyl pentapeptide phosphotransferase/UDP-N-acetylglucosamine-1-phosphate transferase
MSSTIDESGWLPFDNQKARTLPQRRTVYLHVLAGGLVILLSIFVDYILAEPPAWGPMQSVTLATGIGIVAIGFADPHGSIISRVSSNLCLSLLGVFLLLAAGEVFFRAVAFDFTGGEEAWRRIPSTIGNRLFPRATPSSGGLDRNDGPVRC